MQFVRERTHRKHINLTPIIDIVFLLIVFFMLTSHFALTESIEMALPSQAGKTPTEATITLIVRPNSQIEFNQEKISVSALRHYLKPLFKVSNTTPVSIRITPNVSVQEMVEVMDEVRLAGGNNIAIVK